MPSEGDDESRHRTESVAPPSTPLAESDGPRPEGRKKTILKRIRRRFSRKRDRATIPIGWPTGEFWKDFWPAFWATAIGALLAIPTGLYSDRRIKSSAAAEILPGICKQLISSQDSLEKFTTIPDLPEDAVGQMGAPLRLIRTGFAQARLQEIDNPTLISTISDAFAALDEVNKYLELYQEAYTSSSAGERSSREVQSAALLSRTSNEANERVKEAIEEIRKSQGTKACQ